MATTETTTDPVAARLAEDKAAAEKLLTAAGHVQEALAVPGLLGRYMPGWDLWGDVEKAAIRWAAAVAALEKVLAQHQPGPFVILGALCPRHETHRHFSITSAEAAGIVACQECKATVYNSCAGCGPRVRLDSCPERAAIKAGLLGESADG
jgi:hypothetical protein